MFHQLFSPCISSIFQTFSRYLSYKRDNNELLLFVLKQLTQDQMTFQRNRYGSELEIVEIAEKDLADKVREREMKFVMPFRTLCFEIWCRLMNLKV